MFFALRRAVQATLFPLAFDDLCEESESLDVASFESSATARHATLSSRRECQTRLLKVV